MRTIRLSNNALNQLTEVEGISEMFVTQEAMNRIKEICYIGAIFNTEEELRGVRAGIVKDFHQMEEDALSNQNLKLYFRLRDVVSATVATIDTELLNRGYGI